MKILLTSTSFQDTPGKHQKILKQQNFDIDFLRGPIKEKEILPIIHKYDGIICGDDEITRNVIIKGKKGKLKVISKYGIGLDKVDLKAAKEFDIPVTNTPGVNHITVAEHVLALLFTYYKNIHFEYNITKQNKWQRLIGHEIFGKNIGILGLGRIGKELAIRASALGMNVYATDISKDEDFIKKNNIKWGESINDLIPLIDILSLNMPLTNETKEIIDKSIFDKCNKRVIIVNTARAGLINLENLIEALKNKKISAYLTDVLEDEPMIQNHPLLKFDNVIITPHIGSRTYESVERQGTMAVENLMRILFEFN